jgi:NAD+ synthase
MHGISSWIKQYAVKNNLKALIIGISGGIDSALVSTLCAETGLPTYVISLPIKQKKDQLIRAQNHAKWLLKKYDNVVFIEKDLTLLYQKFENSIEKQYKTELSLANSKSRLRMVTLYQYAGSLGGLVVGTGNKVEDFGVGFFTKYGDGGVDLSPIGNLTKSQVKKLAKKFNINAEILKAKPTDGLWEVDRTDEEQLGASYEELEWAMQFRGNILKQSKRKQEVFKIYKKFNKVNKHKMISIPVYRGKI